MRADATSGTRSSSFPSPDSRGRHCAGDARRGVVGEEFGRARRVSTEASRLARGFRAASREDACRKFLSPGAPSKTRSPPLAGGPSASVRSGARARARATISFMAAPAFESVGPIGFFFSNFCRVRVLDTARDADSRSRTSYGSNYSQYRLRRWASGIPMGRPHCVTARARFRACCRADFSRGGGSGRGVGAAACSRW